MHDRCHKDAVNYRDGGAGSWRNWQKFLSVRRYPSEAAENVFSTHFYATGYVIY